MDYELLLQIICGLGALMLFLVLMVVLVTVIARLRLPTWKIAFAYARSNFWEVVAEHMLGYTLERNSDGLSPSEAFYEAYRMPRQDKESDRPVYDRKGFDGR